MSPSDKPPSGPIPAAPISDPQAMRWLVYAMAVGWCEFGSLVTVHTRPAWSLPKKITFTLSGVVIFILLIATQRKGRFGCAVMFFLLAAFIIGAVWVYVYTIGPNGTILDPE